MDNIMDQENWNQYLIPGTEILKNKFNIKNIDDLKEIENIITRKTIAKLYLNPVKGNFDLEHLKEIHRRIFKDIYPFAGELRNCSLQKDSHVFCNPKNIEQVASETLKNMNKEFEEDIASIPEFAYKLAKYYYNLIYAHPFREGNGRSIRVFIRDFVFEKSKNKSCGPLDLDYTKIDKENLFLGSAERYLYPSYIEMEFMKGLVKLEENKHRKI